MRTILPPILLLSCLAGCSHSSGVVAIGPDTYALSEERAPVSGGGREANRAVLAEAGGFCLRQGRVSVVLDLRPDGDPFTPYYPTAFDLTFQCLAAAEAVLTAGPVVRPAQGQGSALDPLKARP